MKASTWKDKIVLNWDGNIPADINPAAIHHPSDMLHFWQKVNGFAKWNDRFNAFLMNLSLQNYNRVHTQFPGVQWKSVEAFHKLQAQSTFFKKLVEVADKVKYLPLEKLPTYEYKKPPRGEYQHRAVVFLRNIKRAPLFLDCGMGKTFIVLVSTELQIKSGELRPGKTLICAKLMTLEEGWLKDAEKFTNLKLKMLWMPAGRVRRKERIIEMLNEPADAYVINHDGVRIFEEALAAHQFQKVVIDESTILKNFHGMHRAIKGGQFGRSIMNVAANASHRVIMSGTPAPNGPDDLWGQFSFLDPDGVLLEPSFNDFREEFMQLVDLRPKNKRYRTLRDGSTVYMPLGPRDPKQWEVKKDSVERIGGIVNPLAFRAKIRDHITDLPELTTIPHLVDMTPEQKKHYDDMKERLRVVINDTRITVPVKLTQIMKLRQITGGFIIDNEDVPHAMPVNPKLDALDSLLEEIGTEDKVVIYAQYQWEVELIKSRYKDRGIVSVYGGNSSQQNLKNVSDFINDPSVKLAVLHPKSAAHGITFTMAHYMVFYSIDHSAEDNYQCVKRIERMGQKSAMFVYYFLCKASIDRHIYQVVIDKNKAQEQLLGQQTQSAIEDELMKVWGDDGS